MKISVDFIAQGIDPKTKVVKYQSAGPDEAVLLAWFKEKALKGTFAGLECHIQKRYLINGKPFQFHVEQKHILWMLIIVLFAFNLWTILR